MKRLIEKPLAVMRACVVGMLVIAAPVYPAEADPPKDEQKSTRQERDKPSEDNTRDTKNTSKDGGIFIPSEEISEDFAVSFPVDI